MLLESDQLKIDQAEIHSSCASIVVQAVKQEQEQELTASLGKENHHVELAALEKAR